MCAFGPLAELSGFVLNPDAALANAENRVLEFEDEIPFWLAIGHERREVS